VSAAAWNRRRRRFGGEIPNPPIFIFAGYNTMRSPLRA
jgi:hypothetical protein